VRPLLLGGVRLDSDRGTVAHSDGDALLHAVTDAILSAAGLPDIGQLFPDTDAANRDRNSIEFLKEAGRRARDLGWTIANIDATVVLEKPKISPRKDEMRSNIAAALDIDVSRVSVKGKTHEKVDAVGESRAVEVHALALMVRQ
jgi:2-C-methyl-D-erythritol 2,4-cyclodiphosphate synthase